MANATAITLTDLTAATPVAQPTADVLDTGTVAVTLPLALSGRGLDRVILEVKNTAAAALLVEVLAGDDPPAGRAGLGNVTVGAAIAQNAVVMIAAFEGARYAQTDGATKGRLDVKFTPSSGTIGATVRAYRLPKSA